MTETGNGEATISRKRMAGVDAMRLIAFLFVVAVHAGGSLPSAIPKQMFDVIPRFAVPFFFMVSGYFLAGAQGTFLTKVYRLIRRIAPIYIVWVIFYLVFHKAFFGDFGYSSARNLLVDGGPGFHLWFLGALAASVIFFLLVSQSLSMPTALIICSVLYICGTYFVEFRSPFGPRYLTWNYFRDGPFFGSIFVAIGFYIKRYDIRSTMFLSLCLISIGLLMQFSERFLISHLDLVDELTSIDYYFGTIPYAVGVFLLSLHLPDHSRIISSAAKLGRYSLGFYCLHVAYLWIFQFYIPPHDVASVLAAIALTVVCTVMTIVSLSRIRFLRGFMT